MTPEESALTRVIGLLSELGIPYMLTGSLATSYHGRPRATHDTDIVIDPTAKQLESLSARLATAGFYVDADGARQAFRQRRPFNAIEAQHACKVDLIVRKDRPFSREEMGRRLTVDLPFAPAVSMVTAEDAVLSKLEWARAAGDSERQLADAAGVLAITPALDYAYIERWADELGVTDLWRRISTKP